MDSFNVTITIEGQPVSLTLQPENIETYKVVYHDMLVGVIVRAANEDTWEELPMDQVSPGIYKMYEHDASKNAPKVILDRKALAEIGSEIDRQHLSGQA